MLPRCLETRGRPFLFFILFFFLKENSFNIPLFIQMLWGHGESAVVDAVDDVVVV